MVTNAGFSDHQQEQLRLLEAKINALLPPRYQGCFEAVPPRSMGSASLKYAANGQVAWDEIWTTFCHLALAGGPPHRGTFLEPVSIAEALAAPAEQQQVVAEIERAIRLTTELTSFPSPTPGWVGVQCPDEGMAAWLVRAIVAENVVARCEGSALFLPAGPHFRIEKEIKNVVTSSAKTCHYLCDHMEPGAAPKVVTQKLVEPALPEAIAQAPDAFAAAANNLERGLRQTTRLETIRERSPRWIGIHCADEEMAVWLLRAVAVENVLVRREEEVLFLPISLDTGWQQGVDRVIAVTAHALRLWRIREAIGPPDDVFT